MYMYTEEEKNPWGSGRRMERAEANCQTATVPAHDRPVGDATSPATFDPCADCWLAVLIDVPGTPYAELSPGGMAAWIARRRSTIFSKGGRCKGSVPQQSLETKKEARALQNKAG